MEWAGLSPLLGAKQAQAISCYVRRLRRGSKQENMRDEQSFPVAGCAATARAGQYELGRRPGCAASS